MEIFLYVLKMEPDNNWIQWHGFKGDPKWALPRLAAASEKAGRADQGNTIKANEFLDDDDVVLQKMTLVAQLVKLSKYSVAYTGAGLSKASGIPDYATKAENSVIKSPVIKSNLDAQPTYAHCVITAMERAGLIHHYVQQNHDGLPQKSGFPQEKINEIHGAWFDPSNPVVMFGGQLRSDLFQRLVEEEKKVDLCLCLGTSLSGMNADRTAHTPAKKSAKGKALGVVIINLQQTKLDSSAAVRVWAPLDLSFKILGELLGLGEIKPIPAVVPGGDVYLVPYNSEGKYDPTCSMTLDLRNDTPVVISTEGVNFGVTGKIVGKRDDNYTVLLEESDGPKWRLLGNWWVDAALRGAVPSLPVINLLPVVAVVEEKKKEKIVFPKSLKILQSHYLKLDVESGDNNHQWGLSLSPSAENIVEEVTWILHPTFHHPEVHCTTYPFAIRRHGWGTFNVKVKIVLKKISEDDKEPVVVNAAHELDFSVEGDEVRVTEVPLNIGSESLVDGILNFFSF